jgi:hypothetical protein
MKAGINSILGIALLVGILLPALAPGAPSAIPFTPRHAQIPSRPGERKGGRGLRGRALPPRIRSRGTNCSSGSSTGGSNTARPRSPGQPARYPSVHHRKGTAPGK